MTKKTILILIVLSFAWPDYSRVVHMRDAFADDNEPKTTTLEVSIGDLGRSDNSNLYSEWNKFNEFEEVEPEDGSNGALSSFAAPRYFIDVFYGKATTLDGTVSVTTRSSGAFCLFPPCTGSHSVRRNVAFRPSAVYGIRVGKWFEDYPYFGLAGDFSYLEANGPGVRIWYVPLSIVMMGRYPMFRSGSVPDGRLRLYGGALLSMVIGDMRVDFTPETSSTVEGPASRLVGGPGGLLGIAWHLPFVAFFTEYRMMKIDLDFEKKGILGGSTTANADLQTRQLVFGMSYEY